MLDDSRPIPFVYEGNGRFIGASTYWCNQIERLFQKHGRYVFSHVTERSWQTHAHYFVQVQEAWANLPEGMEADFSTPEMLRKHALIATGHFHERKFLASSEEEAWRIAKFLQSGAWDYSVVSVNGAAVIERRPVSQSYKNMGRSEFQKSKSDVLEWVWTLIGVDPETGAAEAGDSA